MKAKHLKPGDVFTIDPPDCDSPTRVCLTNDAKNGLRFGFPNNRWYWCWMGLECDVELVVEDKECPHGNPLGDCDACDVAGDLAFDADREDRFFR